MAVGSWSPGKPDTSVQGVPASPWRASHVSAAEKKVGRESSEPRPDEILSWAIAVICFVINFVSSVFNRCAGLFFNSMMSTFEASRGEVAVPVSLYGGFYNLAGLVAAALIPAFGVRKTMILGGVMMSIGFCVSMFASSTTFLVFTVGLATGAGQGIVMSSSIVAVTRYFDKWRGIALGLNLAGPPVTSLVIPNLLLWMLDEYGLRGTFLLVGACFANVAALGILLHKPPWEKKKSAEACLETAPDASEKVTQSFPPRHYVSCDSQHDTAEKVRMQIEHSPVQENRKPMKQSGEDLSPARRSTLTSVNRLPAVVTRGTMATFLTEKTLSSRRGTMQSGPKSLGASTRTSFASSNIHGAESEGPPLGVASLERSIARERRGTIMSVAGSMFAIKRNNLSEVNRSLRRSTLVSVSSSCNLSSVRCDPPCIGLEEAAEEPGSFSISSVKAVLKQQRLYLYSLSYFTFSFFVDSYLSVIFDFAEDIGVPPSESVYALTLFSAFDTVGRFCIPFLSDYKVISTQLLLTLSYLALALISEVAPFLSGKLAFMSIAALFGIPGGYIMVGSSEVLSNELGTKNLPMAYGFMTLVGATGYFIRPPIIGLFRDRFGSYNGLFQLLGGMLLLCFVVNLVLWIRSRNSRKKNIHHTQDNAHAFVPGTLPPVNEESQHAPA